MIAGENKEKQNSLKEHLSALRTAEKTSFLNNTTTIERVMFMSPPKSQLSMNSTIVSHFSNGRSTPNKTASKRTNADSRMDWK